MDPVVVSLTYFEGHEIPMVEIWRREVGCAGIAKFPYLLMLGPAFASEEERRAANETARTYTFTTGELLRYNRASASGGWSPMT